ncbi:response regulator [Oceanospirillum sanctuarii]|uniref:response regulator n=1 Tax=Oceanospirillum sanctuarii TaxID=1434821 RepID=UPI000A3B5CF5|nr:response regulator [Oceanospirillum sanctuarii]
MKTARILVVDDAKFTRDLMVKAVKAEYPQFEVETAQDGRKAQKLLEIGRFDLVLCDWEMPEMSGIELLTWLRENEESRNKDVPFIMVTSLGDKEYVVEAAQHGVTDYITKPFNNDQLVNKVTKQLVKSEIISREELAEIMNRRTRVMGGGTTANVLTSKQGMQTASMQAGRRVRGKAMLMFGENKLPVVIRELNTQEVVVMAKRGQAIPELFEELSVGFIAGQGEQQMRLTANGSVVLMQAQEKRTNAEAVYVGVRFTDMDQKSGQLLSKIIARLSS